MVCHSFQGLPSPRSQCIQYICLVLDAKDDVSNAFKAVSSPIHVFKQHAFDLLLFFTVPANDITQLPREYNYYASRRALAKLRCAALSPAPKDAQTSSSSHFLFPESPFELSSVPSRMSQCPETCLSKSQRPQSQEGSTFSSNCDYNVRECDDMDSVLRALLWLSRHQSRDPEAASASSSPFYVVDRSPLRSTSSASSQPNAGEGGSRAAARQGEQLGRKPVHVDLGAEFPFLLVRVSSGVALVLVEAPHKYQFICGTRYSA